MLNTYNVFHLNPFEYICLSVRGVLCCMMSYLHFEFVVSNSFILKLYFELFLIYQTEFGRLGDENIYFFIIFFLCWQQTVTCRPSPFQFGLHCLFFCLCYSMFQVINLVGKLSILSSFIWRNISRVLM